MKDEKISPDLESFIKENCDHCEKKYDIPSVEVFACIFDKLAEKDRQRRLKNE
jgi:hypothetical protein